MNHRLYAILLSIILFLSLLLLVPNIELQGLRPISSSVSAVDGTTINLIAADSLAFSCAGVTEIPQLECEALVALYNSTSGASWTNHTDWLVTNTPCNWFGVVCFSGHVDVLNLYENKLSGPIPVQLGNLTRLRELRLYINQLNGSIPAELGNLTSLTVFQLASNNLTGSIPTSLSNLTGLRELRLNSNLLSGGIPREFGNVINLNQLHLAFNQLSGSIPPELGNLTNLDRLTLTQNQLSGEIPASIANLRNLTQLSIGNNQLSGNIPSQLGNLPNLTSLTLDNSQFTGALPSSFVNLTKLQTFWFNSTSLCEPGDTAFQAWLAGISSLQRTGVICTETPTNTPTQTSTATPTPPNNTPTSTPVPTADGSWVTESIPDTYASSVSLAMDDIGNPHISYHGVHYLQRDLRYAWRAGGVWTIEVVDDGYEAGMSTSIALDRDGNPHIIYQSGGGDVRTLSLKHAYRTATGWVSETIETGTFLGAYGASFALDSDGQPHVSYTGAEGPRYAFRTSSGWTIEPMAFAGSLALDANNNPHISYVATNSLKYAYRTATGWITEDVDGAYTTPSSSVLALDTDGQPHISYLWANTSSTWGKELRYAFRTASGWITETVDTADADSSSALINVSMAVTTADNPHITYSKIFWLIKHAYRTKSGWVAEVVAGTSFSGNQSSIALDTNGNPHIAYGKSALTYAYKEVQGTATATSTPTNTLTPTSTPISTPVPNADLGFRPNPNGYQFNNQQLIPSPEKAWDMFEQFYGTGNVRKPDGTKCILAETYAQNDYRTMSNGWACYGYAASSLINYLNLPQLNAGPFAIPQSNRLYDQPQSTQLSDPIAYYARTQLTKKGWGNDEFNAHVIECRTNTLSPIERLKRGIQNRQPFALNLNTRKGYWHAVLPYRIESISSNEAYVYVYDSERHGEERRIHFYRVENDWRWEYTFVGSLSFVGTPQNTNCEDLFFYPLDMALNRGEPLIDFCAQRTGDITDVADVISAGTGRILAHVPAKGNWVIRDTTGKRLGWIDSQLINEIPNAYEIPQSLGTEPLLNRTLYLPEAEYLVEASNLPTQIIDPIYYGDGRMLTLYERLHAPSLFSSVQINSSLTRVTLFERQNWGPFNLVFDSEFSTSSRLAAVGGNNGSDAGNVIVGFDGEQVTVSQTAGVLQYNVILEQTGTQQSIFISSPITLGNNERHTIRPTNWTNLGTYDILLEIDRGQDGVIDETRILKSAIYRIYLPIITNNK